MAKPLIYLDACCLNRPSDDLNIARNRLEAEAVLSIVLGAQSGVWHLASSPALEFEVRRSPSPLRRHAVLELLEIAKVRLPGGEQTSRRAEELIALGFGGLDALHLAFAESGSCDVFLTTDDLLLRKAKRLSPRLAVPVENPLAWLLEQQR